MKLVLASQGFTTPEIAQEVAELVGKHPRDINVAVINEAYAGIAAGKSQRWLIGELSLIGEYMQGVISFVNLRAHTLSEVEKRLGFADVIYIVGGAPIILPKLFRETGFDKVLPRLAATKVTMGTSAGANVLGKPIEDPAYWQVQYGASAQYLAEPTLGLVDFNIIPHFGREDRPLRIAENLTPLLKDNPFTLYGVTDTQAVIFNDGKTRFVGGAPVIFGKRPK